MGKKLSDLQIKHIISERAEGNSYRVIAKKYKVSESTVRNYCSKNDDFAEICAIKKEENAKSVLEHMDKRKDAVCDIINSCLDELSDPNRLKAATIKDIATIMGIVIDKFTKNEEKHTADNGNIEKLIEGLKNGK